MNEEKHVIDLKILSIKKFVLFKKKIVSLKKKISKLKSEFLMISLLKILILMKLNLKF